MDIETLCSLFTKITSFTYSVDCAYEEVLTDLALAVRLYLKAKGCILPIAATFEYQLTEKLLVIYMGDNGEKWEGCVRLATECALTVCNTNFNYIGMMVDVPERNNNWNSYLKE